jgi:endonuclease-3 related protein
MAGTPFERLIGTVLGQNTSQKNVARILENLREAGVLDAESLNALSDEELEDFVRPAGYARIKARRLRNLLTVLVERYDGSTEQMFAAGLQTLRGELLSINGIGPETADSILLEAGGLPSFVVNTHVQRVLKRHGWVDFSADPEQIKDEVESSLEPDAALYQQLHALFERVGGEHCRKTPKCDGCPLEDLLPDSGPLQPPDF